MAHIDINYNDISCTNITAKKRRYFQNVIKSPVTVRLTQILASETSDARAPD